MRGRVCLLVGSRLTTQAEKSRRGTLERLKILRQTSSAQMRTYSVCADIHAGRRVGPPKVGGFVSCDCIVYYDSTSRSQTPMIGRQNYDSSALLKRGAEDQASKTSQYPLANLIPQLKLIVSPTQANLIVINPSPLHELSLGSCRPRK